MYSGVQSAERPAASIGGMLPAMLRAPGAPATGSVALAAAVLLCAPTVRSQPCGAYVTPQTTRRVFDAAGRLALPPAYRFDGVRTEGSTLAVRFVRGASPCPPLTVTPRACVDPSARTDALVLSVPPALRDACPELAAVAHDLDRSLRREAAVGDAVPRAPSPWPRVLRTAAMIALAASLFAARRRLVAALRDACTGVPSRAVDALRSLRDARGSVLATLALALAAFVALNRFRADPLAMGHDGAIWFAQARDCLALGRCVTSGAQSSFGPASGAVWTHVVLAVTAAGADTVRLRGVVLVSWAAALATLGAVLARWLRPAVAATTVLLALAALAGDPEPNRLWNPSFALLPDVLAFAATLVAAWSPSRAALAFAGIFLALAVHTHLGAAVLAPALAVVAVLGAPGSARRLAVAAAAFVVACLVVAPGATLLDAAFVQRNLPRGSFVVAAAMLAGAARWAGPWFRSASREARAAMLAACVVLPWEAGMYVVQARIRGFPYGAADALPVHHIYAFAALAPAAVLASLALCEALALGARVVPARMTGPAKIVADVLAVALAVGLVARWPALRTQPSPHRSWSLEDVRSLAAHLDRRGWSPERLAGRLQNAACVETLSNLAAFAGPPSTAPPPPGTQLRVWLLEARALPARLPDGMEVLRLRRDRVAVTSALRSRLDADGATYCVGASCEPMRAPDPRGRGAFLFTRRPGAWQASPTVPTGVEESLHLALAPIAEDRTLTFVTADRCPWRVLRVEGVDAAMDGARTVLLRGSDRAGTLVLGRSTATCAVRDVAPPCFVEHAPGDPAALDDADLSR